MKWISIKDRLPSNGYDIVLVYDRRYGCRESVGIACYGKDGWDILDNEDSFYCEGACCSKDHVTHWMPVPQFPEEQK